MSVTQCLYLCFMTGLASGWHLESVDIFDETMGKKFRFRCDRWLAKKEDDGQIMRELACANNDVLDFDEKTSKMLTDTHVLIHVNTALSIYPFHTCLSNWVS